MNSEVFFNDDFSENCEKMENDETVIKKINFSWVRVLVCFLIFVGLLLCNHFHTSYYEKFSTFYSINFENDDEKIVEMKNLVLEKFKDLRFKIKEKINHL